VSWHCPYCGEGLPDERAPHCGEVGHAVEDEQAEQALQQQAMQAMEDDFSTGQ